MGCWKVLETGQSTWMPRARPLAGKVKLVNGAEWLQHRSHTFGRLKRWKRIPRVRNVSSLAIWGSMWMIFCGWPPKNILEEALAALEEKFTLATPEWVTMENRWRTRSPSVGMKSQRPNRAMLWGKRNTSETSSRSTTSVRQLESLAQSLKRDQKSPARTSPVQ